MKHLVAAFICWGIFSLNAAAQESSLHLPIDPDTKTITYQEVVHEEGTREELFNRASTWLRIFYKNPMEVSRVRDLATGVIRGQHRIKVYHTDKDSNKIYDDMVLYSFKIECRDGRYRYTVYDFLVKKLSKYPLENWLNKEDPLYSPYWDGYLRQIDTFVREEWIPSLKSHMKPEIKKEEEPW